MGVKFYIETTMHLFTALTIAFNCFPLFSGFVKLLHHLAREMNLTEDSYLLVVLEN